MKKLLMVVLALVCLGGAVVLSTPAKCEACEVQQTCGPGVPWVLVCWWNEQTQKCQCVRWTC